MLSHCFLRSFKPRRPPWECVASCGTTLSLPHRPRLAAHWRSWRQLARRCISCYPAVRRASAALRIRRGLGLDPLAALAAQQQVAASESIATAAQQQAAALSAELEVERRQRERAHSEASSARAMAQRMRAVLREIREELAAGRGAEHVAAMLEQRRDVDTTPLRPADAHSTPYLLSPSPTMDASQAEHLARRARVAERRYRGLDGAVGEFLAECKDVQRGLAALAGVHKHGTGASATKAVTRM